MERIFKEEKKEIIKKVFKEELKTELNEKELEEIYSITAINWYNTLKGE